MPWGGPSESFGQAIATVAAPELASPELYKFPDIHPDFFGLLLQKGAGADRSDAVHFKICYHLVPKADEF